MAITNITARLDSEESVLTGLINATSPAPSPYAKALLEKTIGFISQMRKTAAEAEADYALRINARCQDSPAGYWSANFWSNLEAAVASDTASFARGGLGRGQ